MAQAATNIVCYRSHHWIHARKAATIISSTLRSSKMTGLRDESNGQHRSLTATNNKHH